MKQNEENRGSFKAGVKACMPTVLGYWSIGFAAGGIGSLSGFSVPEVGLLAGLLYAGSAQFLFYTLTASGADVIAIVLSVLLINTRYILMSSYLSIYFKKNGFVEKFIGGALLTDETFGVASQHAKVTGALPFRWLLGLNLTAYVNWLIANITGAALAKNLPNSITDGLSFSLIAMFVGLLLLTFFASSSRLRELIAIIVAASIVLLLFGYTDLNVVILVATVIGALASSIVSFFKMKREYKWIRHSS